MEKFYERLSYLMDDVLQLSGNKVGKDLKWNVSSVFRFKKGETEPSHKFTLQFCEFYGVSANWLLMGIEPMMLKDLIPVDLIPGSNIIGIRPSVIMEDLNRISDLVMDVKEKYGKHS